MENLEYYMNLNYKIENIKDETEGGYVLSIPQLKGCITCADNLEKGMKMLEDAKKQWLIAALECGYKIPEPYKQETIQASSSFVFQNLFIKNWQKNQKRKASA